GVLAFLVDPQYAWTERTEQDDLTDAKDETAAVGVYRHVRGLAELKSFLQGHYLRATFTTPDDLAGKAAASLHNWLEEAEQTTAAAIPTGPRNNLPARPLFVGRDRDEARVLAALASPAPIVLIDGIGGIGKTALALDVAYVCLEASRGQVHDANVPAFSAF